MLEGERPVSSRSTAQVRFEVNLPPAARVVRRKFRSFPRRHCPLRLEAQKAPSESLATSSRGAIVLAHQHFCHGTDASRAVVTRSSVDLEPQNLIDEKFLPGVRVPPRKVNRTTFSLDFYVPGTQRTLARLAYHEKNLRPDEHSGNFCATPGFHAAY